MVFRNPNTKRKYTKRQPNTKRKYTKRHHNTKRKYTNRKSKKYGGKCINMHDADVEKKMNKLIDHLQRIPGFSFAQAKDVVEGMVNSEYNYDCDNILKKLKIAVKNVADEQIIDTIYETLNKIEQQAKQSQQSQQPKSIPQNPVETQKEVSPHNPVETQKEVPNDGCPSDGREPVNCSEKKDYIKQTLIFHPDKNLQCIEDSTKKFQALQNNTTCQFN